MKNETGFRDLIDLLSNLEEEIKNMKLSLVERDIILGKISKLYENALFSPDHKTSDSPTHIIDEQEIISEKSTTSKLTETITVTSEPVIQKKTESEILPEPVIEPVKPLKTEVIKETEIRYTEKEVKKENRTLSDKFISKNSTLGETLNNIRSQNDVVTRLAKSPVTNLKNAISINDRIMFTKDLFKGNSDIFHSTIEEINKLKTLDEAMEILSGKVELNEEGPAVEKFMEILYRRFVTTDESLK